MDHALSTVWAPVVQLGHPKKHRSAPPPRRLVIPNLEAAWPVIIALQSLPAFVQRTAATTPPAPAAVRPTHSAPTPVSVPLSTASRSRNVPSSRSMPYTLRCSNNIRLVVPKSDFRVLQTPSSPISISLSPEPPEATMPPSASRPSVMAASPPGRDIFPHPSRSTHYLSTDSDLKSSPKRPRPPHLEQLAQSNKRRCPEQPVPSTVSPSLEASVAAVSPPRAR